MREIRHQTGTDGVGDTDEHDGNRLRLLLQHHDRTTTTDQNNVRIEAHQFASGRAHPFHIIRGPAFLDA